MYVITIIIIIIIIIKDNNLNPRKLTLNIKTKILFSSK